MARIHIDSVFFGDPRHKRIERMLQSIPGIPLTLSDFVRCRLLDIYHHCYRELTSLMTKEEIETYTDIQGFADILINCGLADETGEGLVRIRGIDSRIEGLVRKIGGAQAGGKRSAENRKAKFGSAAPRSLPSQAAEVDRSLPSRSFAPPRSFANPVSVSVSVPVSVDPYICEIDTKKGDLFLFEGGGPAPAPATAIEPEVCDPKPAKKAKVPNPANALAWEAYSAAYAQRYGVEPIRNAQVNAMVAQIVQRVGASKAPAMLAFYVLRANSAFYISKRHTIRYALHDCESLCVDMEKGRIITNTESRDAERTVSNYQTAQRVIEQLRKEKESGKVD